MAKKPYRSVCGLSAEGVDDLIDRAEAADAGTSRHPWPKKFKAKVKDEIEGMDFMPAVEAQINALVLKDLGPGLFNRGPFKAGQ